MLRFSAPVEIWAVACTAALMRLYFRKCVDGAPTKRQPKQWMDLIPDCLTVHGYATSFGLPLFIYILIEVYNMGHNIFIQAIKGSVRNVHLCMQETLEIFYSNFIYYFINCEVL